MTVQASSLWEYDPTTPSVRSVEGPDIDLGRPESQEHRWRSQTVTAPIEGMVRAGAYAGEPDDRYDTRYDLRRLAHRAIDVVVSSMGFAQELTDTELISGLAAAASRMAPDAGQEEWTAVAQFVYGHLMNAPDDFAKFSYPGIDEEGQRRLFEFQLLVPRATGDGIAINASAEAINVFLKAFELDVTDAEVAFSVMLDRQISDGRFEAAASTAEAAGRLSRAVAARVTELLEDTKRDVDSVDWRHGTMRAELERARRHVASRITEDDRLLDHVQGGTENEDPAIRAASGGIAALLTGCKRLHLDLEGRLVRAHRTFLDAQLEQRLARRVRLRLLSLEDQLFVPALRLPADDSKQVTDTFAISALGPAAPRAPWLYGLITALLTPSRLVEPAPCDAEEPELDDEPEMQAHRKEALDAARAIFAAAAATPRRLGALLVEARATGDLEVVELVRLGALWAFAPDAPDDADVDAISTADELTAGLVSADDGTALDDPEFGGADLLVGRPEMIDALLDPPETPALAEPAPISIDAYRNRR